MDEPKVKKAAEQLDKLIKAGKVNPADLDLMVKEGLDKETAAYWKKYWGQTDGGAEFAAGSQLTVDIFSAGQVVDVQGKSIGKGFAGGIKRHHFSMQDATHGNSRSHRVLGSIGMCQTPGRVFKGKKMEGHLGAVKRTIQNLTIHAIDAERNLILVKGSVPGAKGGDVIITPAMKMRNKG